MFIEALAAPVFVVIGNSHAFEEFVDCDYRRIYKRIALFFHYQKRATIRLKLHALIILKPLLYVYCYYHKLFRSMPGIVERIASGHHKVLA